MTLKGVQFVSDMEGKRTAVLIDLKRCRPIWEDFYDASVARQRQSEPRDTLGSVKRRLRRRGKLSSDG